MDDAIARGGTDVDDVQDEGGGIVEADLMVDEYGESGGAEPITADVDGGPTPPADEAFLEPRGNSDDQQERISGVEGGILDEDDDGLAAEGEDHQEQPGQQLMMDGVSRSLVDYSQPSIGMPKDQGGVIAEPDVPVKRTWRQILGFGGESGDDEEADEEGDPDPVPKTRVNRSWRLGLFSCLSFEDGAGIQACMQRDCCGLRSHEHMSLYRPAAKHQPTNPQVRVQVALLRCHSPALMACFCPCYVVTETAARMDMFLPTLHGCVFAARCSRVAWCVSESMGLCSADPGTPHLLTG
jgi:hypothetical protein